VGLKKEQSCRLFNGRTSSDEFSAIKQSPPKNGLHRIQIFRRIRSLRSYSKGHALELLFPNLTIEDDMYRHTGMIKCAYQHRTRGLTIPKFGTRE
jgi:hypothetical protein